MTDNKRRFVGKTAIVTGAGSGIGRATAIQLAEEGARVIAVDMIAERLDHLTAERPDLDLVPVSVDLTSDGASDRIVAAAQGKLDVLVNNAGIMDKFQSVAETSDATWDKVFAVNLTAMMRLMRAAIPVMKAGGHGAIVNIASGAGLWASAAGAAYTASKHAVVGLSKNTALFHAADGIRTNCICPGPVATDIEAHIESQIYLERVAPYGRRLPVLAKPEQLAAGICFLASDEASYFNGAVVPCDGGKSAI